MANNDTTDRRSQFLTRFDHLGDHLDRVVGVFEAAQTLDNTAADVEVNNTVFLGDLTLNGATNLTELNNVVVKGNLVISATCNVTARNLVVEGNVTIGNGAGNVIWIGGTFGGTLTDVGVELVGPPAAGAFIAQLS
jgi:hypothetical protein